MTRLFVRFSTNEGETWTEFLFSKREVYVYQLLTEPGEKSTIFTIFGSYADQKHSWLILQLNASDVLGKSKGSRRKLSVEMVWVFSVRPVSMDDIRNLFTLLEEIDPMRTIWRTFL